MRRTALLLAALLVVPALVMVAPTASASTGFAWGSDTSPWWTYMDAERSAALRASTASGMALYGLDAKDGHGYASWQTTRYPTFTTFATGDGAVERGVRDAHAKGLHVVARFDVFEDTVASKKFPHAAIGGSPTWVDPACPDVRAYLIDMAKDLVSRTKIDEINWDHVRYPLPGEAPGTAKLPCTGGTLDKPAGDRTKIVADWVRDASAAVRSVRPGIMVSASLFPETMVGPHAAIGQDAKLLAPHLDVIMPMTYPDYWWQGSSRSDYDIVYGNVNAGVKAFGAAKIRPWLQGDGAFAGNVQKVCDEVRAARDAGASGAMVWWFPSMGVSETTWKSIRDCAKLGAAPAPTPAPEPFSATFRPKAGNEWWVEVHVDANRAPARVTANIEGKAAVDLTLRSWGAWAGSFHVPAGSNLRFTAFAADGSRVESPTAYTWPSATLATDAFSATFRPKAGNAWWVEVNVDANQALAKVRARVDGGAARDLTLRSWGAWAGSFHVPAGAKVSFEAVSTSGATVSSPHAFNWPDATPATFDASFTRAAGNRYWVEVSVDANQPLKGVIAKSSDGQTLVLAKQLKGTWAASARLPSTNAVLTFTAEATDGQRDSSAPMKWT